MTRKLLIAALLLLLPTAAFAANPTLDNEHALGLVFHTNALGCSCGCDFKAEMYEKYNDTSSAQWWSKRYSTGTDEDIHLWLNRKKEGGTTGYRPGIRYACDGLDDLAGCTCCNFSPPCVEAPINWTWLDTSMPALQSDWWDQDGDGEGDGSGTHLTHEGRTALFTDFTGVPYSTDNTNPDNIDPRNRQFGSSDCISSGCPEVASPGEMSFNGHDTNVFAISQNSFPEDQYVLSYLSCDGCSSSNQDHIMNLRRSADGSNLYQCKFEFFEAGATPASVKWNVVRSGTPGGFCGQISASSVTGAPTTLPMWGRCEVWTDDDDADGKDETHAAIFLASDNSGVPGTWKFMVELRQEVTDGLSCTYGDGSSDNCGSCAGWTAGDPWLSDGLAAWGLAKSADHNFDDVMAGSLINTPRVRGRRTQ